MTSRDRVLYALNHQEPDRVPFFFGTSGVTAMLAPAYEQLKAALGIRRETRFLSRAMQYALIDEEALERFPSDGRPLLPHPAPSKLRREISPEEFIDEWGVRWRMSPATLYFEVVEAPLRQAVSADLDGYPWPDLSHPSRFQGLAEQGRALQRDGYAVVCLTGTALFEQIQLLRGMDTWLTDLAADPEFAQALLDKVAGLMKASLAGLLEAAGDYIDVIVTGDDLGTQNAPIISPAMYRRLLKPYHAAFLAEVHSRSQAKVLFHSDGSIRSLIPDLIDVGVDLLNPVQVSAKDMGDTAGLKQEFGDRLSFCGAIDTQWALPRGTPAEVRAEVRRRMKDLAPGGGYVAAAVHCIQPDVPLANLYALFDEVATAGRYPISR